jgi:hypothetical protein
VYDPGIASGIMRVAVVSARIEQFRTIPSGITWSAGRHETTVERMVRNLKNKMRSTLFSIKYNLPTCLYGHLLSHVVTSTNLTPNIKTGDNTPRELVTGMKINAKQHLNLPFGEVALFHVPNLSKDRDTSQRAEYGIVIASDLNSHGVKQVWLVNSGKVVHRVKYTKVPLSKEVISMIYAYHKTMNLDTMLTEPDQHLQITGMHNMNDQIPVVTNTSGQITGVTNINDQQHEATINDTQHEATSQDVPPAPQLHQDEGPPATQDQHEITQQVAQPPPVDRSTTTKYNLRPQPARKTYGFHLTVRQSRASYPDLTDEAIHDEVAQMLNMKVWYPVHVRELSAQQRHQIIPCSIFLKEKINKQTKKMKLKGRLVASGNYQDRSLYPASTTSSPTVATAAVMMILGISACMKWHTRVMDIKGAFLNADIQTGKVFIRIPKHLAAVVVKQDCNYANFVESDGTIIVGLSKALYGLVEAPLLWHKDLVETIKKAGFKQCHGDPCTFVRNKCLVCIHVDDLLAVAEHEEDIEMLEHHLKQAYQDVTVQPSDSFSYLGMEIRKCSTKPSTSSSRNAKSKTPNSELDEIIVTQAEFAATLARYGNGKIVSTPSNDALFNCSEDAETMDEKECANLRRI